MDLRHVRGWGLDLRRGEVGSSLLEVAIFRGTQIQRSRLCAVRRIGGGRCRGKVDFIAGRGNFFRRTRRGGLVPLAAVGDFGGGGFSAGEGGRFHFQGEVDLSLGGAVFF